MEGRGPLRYFLSYYLDYENYSDTFATIEEVLDYIEKVMNETKEKKIKFSLIEGREVKLKPIQYAMRMIVDKE